MRVLPLGNLFTAISGRSVDWLTTGSAMGRNIWFQVLPPSLDRQTPFANAEA
jgi:hypothetical protein